MTQSYGRLPAVLVQGVLAIGIYLAASQSNVCAETQSPCSVVGAGVDEMSSAGLAVHGTLGEAIVGSSGSFTTLQAGFWPCAASDYDGDGVPDPVDECTDWDDDGYGDPGFPANTCALDNCAVVPNPAQTDTDGDGSGDACDDDDDNDQLQDGEDNCPWVSNEDQADFDDDGYGDACDNCYVIPNGDCAVDPLNCDADGDGTTTPEEEGSGYQTDDDSDGCGNPCDPLTAEIEFSPGTINKRSLGTLIECRIWLGPYYSVADIDPFVAIELTIAGSVPILDLGREMVGDQLNVEFPRQEVHDAAPLGESVEFVVHGMMTYGCDFVGVDYLRVIGEGQSHSNAYSDADPSTILDDAEKGSLAALGIVGAGSLGETECLVAYQSNYGFDLNTDPEDPVPGAAFFYLYKFCGGTADCTLGETSDGTLRTPSSGGCEALP